MQYCNYCLSMDHKLSALTCNTYKWKKEESKNYITICDNRIISVICVHQQKTLQSINYFKAWPAIGDCKKKTIKRFPWGRDKLAVMWFAKCAQIFFL
jgi:hypothetical protein